MREKLFCSYCAEALVRKHVEGRERRFCIQCNEPLYENPVPANCLIVVNESDRLLLVKRSVEPKAGLWCLPGGFMELDEDPEASALRELKEETGLKGRIDRLFDIASHSSPRYHTVLIICYLVKSFTGKLRPGDDASDTAFFDPNNLPTIAFSTHLKFIHRRFNS